MDSKQKTIPEMRHEVIDNTIEIELMLENIIQIDMGFEPDYQEIMGEDGKPEFMVDNENGIHRFRKFFLEKMSLEKKFDIIKDIIKEDSKKSVPSNMWEEAKRLREIRNKFAHTLAPKYPLYKPGTIGIPASDFEAHSKHFEEWEKLHKEHSELYHRIYNIIWNLFYTSVKLEELK